MGRACGTYGEEVKIYTTLKFGKLQNRKTLGKSLRN